LIFIMRFFL